MAGVAAKRGGAEVVLRGQPAVGDPGHEVPVDELPVGMGADGTAIRHEKDHRH